MAQTDTPTDIPTDTTADPASPLVVFVVWGTPSEDTHPAPQGHFRTELAAAAALDLLVDGDPDVALADDEVATWTCEFASPIPGSVWADPELGQSGPVWWLERVEVQ